MDTPEGDISALQSGRIEPLPCYEEHDDEQNLQMLLQSLSDDDSPPYRKTLDGGDVAEIDSPGAAPGINVAKVPRNVIINGFFEAISNGQDDVISIFISKGLATANTIDVNGNTPLLAAVATKNVGIVKQILDLGAEPDAFGVVANEIDQYGSAGSRILVSRTPLQLSASIGHLPLVKLFMEHYKCDDSLVAPDGQIALRLAATNGHREVVEYLPSRRGGGFLRWKTQHRRSILRVRHALRRLVQFFKFFIWDMPKFFVWTVPKHVVVKPIAKGCTWCWNHKGNLGPWVKKNLKEVPRRVKGSAAAVWRGVKTIPRGFGREAKRFWRFCTTDVPRIARKLGNWIWTLLRWRIPTAVGIAATWVFDGLTSAANAVRNVVLRFLSLLHTVLTAVVTFFQRLTLKDIWNGVVSCLRAAFVTFPKIILAWAENFGDASYKFMKTLFGVLGEIIWYICLALAWLFTFVPVKFWEIVKSLGQSFAKAWYEVMVWFSPKA